MNLEEIRQKFPQYNEYDDSQIANALYKKHYANKLEFDEFARRIGYTPPEAVASKAPAAPPPASETFPLLRQIADVPLKVGSGVVTGVRMIADAFGADSSVGQNLRGVEDYIASLYSAQSKQDSKEISRIMKDAEDKGVLDQVVAGVKAFTVAPVDMLSNALGTAAPAILTGLATTIGGAPLLVARGATLGVGALMGSGTVKGAIYDATKSALKENTDLSDKEIEARAIAAQEYGGKNLDQILIGSGLGALGSAVGIEPGLARQLARGIVSKEAVKEAIKKSAAKDTATAAERGVIKQGAITGGKELATEFPQGAQEQLAQNLALQREGFDVPTMRGVVGQGTLEGIAGLGLGAVTGGREAAIAKRELAGEETSGQTEEQRKISDQALKDQFTSAQEQARMEGKGFDQATADMLMPSSTAAGKALVEGVTRPDVTETVPAPVAPKKTRAPKITAEGVTPESIQAASDYVGKIDSGETIKQSDYRKIARSIGLSIPVGKTNAQAVELIRQHLAQQGASNVAGTDTDTSGTGAGVAPLAATTQPAAGAAGPQPGGMVSTGATAQPNLGGAGAQPAALNAGTQRVIADELQDGATPAELITKYGSTPELAASVDTYIKSLSTQGTTSGTTTSQAQQTTAQGQTATAAGPAAVTAPPAKPAGSVSLGDLAPELQDDIQSRRDAIYEMAADDAGPRKIANAYKALNALEELHGLEITRPTTLSAKRDKQGRLRTQDIIEEGGQATATEQDKTPAYQGTDLQEAMNLADKYEKQEEQEKQKAYQESLGAGKARYEQRNLPANTEENYDAVAEEISAKAEAANATRSELVKKAEDLNKQHREAVAEVERLEDAIEAAERNNDQKKLASLREQENEANRRESDLLGGLIDAQTALQDHGPVQNQLEPWYKLDSVDKDIYFSFIRNNTPAEHRQAAAALLDAKNKAGVKSREGEGKMDAAERRAAQNYEDNRAQMSKIFGVQFPAWDKLSPAAKAVYLREIVNNAGQQQDKAFAKLGVKLIQDNKSLSEKEKQKDIEALQQHQRRVQVTSKRRQRLDQRLKRDYDRRAALGIGQTFYGMLPDNIVKLIKDNNLQGVLNYLRNMPDIGGGGTGSQGRQIAKTVANVIWNMGLKTKIRIVNSLPDEDLAIYDPVKDEILVTAEGLNGATILHEAVHAATVKILSHFVAGRFNMLTASQLAGAKQLQSIMELTKNDLGARFPTHYKNVLEFVAYALTDTTFQQALNDISINLLSGKEQAAYEKLASLFKKSLFTEGKQKQEEFKSALPTVRKAWTDFKLAIAKIFIVGSTVNQKTGVVKNISLSNVMFKKDGTLNEAAPKNLLMEISAAFDDILEVPTEPIYMAKLPTSKAGAAASLTAKDKVEPRGLNPDAEEYKMSERENPTKRSKNLYNTLTTRQGFRTVAKNVQDRAYYSRSLFLKQDRAGNIERDKTKGATNWDEERDLSVGKAKNYVTAEFQKPMDDMRATFQKYLKLSGLKFEQAMSLLQQISEMRHEPERRHVNWVLGVPLSMKQDLVHNGKPISAAQRRIDILGDPRTGKAGLIHKVELTKAQQAALWQELEILAKAPKDGGHADPLGDTPRAESYDKIKKQYDMQGADAKGYSIDENNRIYNALGLEQVDIDKRLEDYKKIPEAERALVEQMFAQAKVISDATMKLDKIGNYWSTPVSNLVGMYNYQNYMPFKGISKSLVDDMSDLNSEVNGADLQDTPHSADGRFTVSDNPFLRLLNDAYRSAARAGRKDYTQAIKNAVEAGLIPGEIKDTIKFEERNIANLSKYKGANSTYLFHYNADGSIDIIKINDLNVLRALRYSFRDASPMLEMANAVTGFFGAQHTRYNYNFAPLNFVRDALTNAWNIGASRQLGPAKALAYIADISTQVVKNGLGKSMEVALLHEKGDPESMRILAKRAKDDPYTRDLLEYLRFGGKTVYMEGFSLSSNLQALNKGLNQSRIVATYEGFTRIIDSWNNMFEFSSRASAYGIYKKEALKKNIAKGMSDKRGPEGQMSPAEEAAATEAAAWVKNLANFEKVGEYGRELGAAYMFIRPAATGAVRAIEAVLPAFTTEKQERADLPPQIANDKAATEKYMENFRQEKKNAQRMITALIGGGMFLWTLSMLTSPDDEWDRNSTKSDNMQQWTRFARFHIPNEVSEQLGIGKDVVFQIPWGFGLGAFAAIGAQICGIGFGNTTFKEGMGNITSSILADSFLPLPISKIEVTESPLKWAVDSIMPTALRPLVEYLMNTNGIGQAINSATTRRLGEAFTGGDRIPEVYKTLSKDIYRQSLGAIDMSPNTLYFFTNSYLDGMSKMFLELPYSLTNLAQGEKTFNLKTDVPLFGSFFGAKTNVDSREYGKMEVKIKEMNQRLTTLEADSPELYGEYISKNPLVPTIVDIYLERQGDLNELRQKATEIRNMRYLSPKDRDSLLKITIMEQNFLKHMMVEDFKAYGLDR